MIGICKNCILFRNGYCFSEDKPEKITGCITKCDYYRLNSFKETYHDGFIDGFGHCNKMKKQPIIERIENRARQEVFNKIVELFNKYDILLEHIDGVIVPVKNSTKQECYDLLYEIQEFIEWRKLLFNKHLSEVTDNGKEETT